MTKLLDEIAQAEREEAALDAHIDAQAEAALAGVAEAEAPNGDVSLDAARLRAAYAPLSSAAKSAIALRISREVRASQAAGIGTPAADAADAAAPTDTKTRHAAPPGRVLPFRRLLGWALPLTAAAAAVAIGIWGADTPAPLHLEQYRLEVASGVSSTERGEAVPDAPASARAPVRIAAHAELVIVLRPERPVTSSVAARAYLRDAAGLLQELPARGEAAPSGALRLSVRPESQWPDRGELVIWVGAADAIPRPDELSLGAPASGPGWQRLEQPFVRAGDD